MKTVMIPLFHSHAKAPKASKLYLRLRSKLVLLYLAMVLLPLAGLAVCLYSAALENAEKTFYTGASASLPVVVNGTEQLAGKLSAFTDAAADRISRSPTEAEKSAELKLLLESEVGKEAAKDLEGAYLITGDKSFRLYGRTDEKTVLGSPSTQSWYQEAKRYPGKTSTAVSMRFTETGAGKPVLSTARTISFRDATPSILLLDFDHSLLDKLADSILDTLPPSCRLLLTDNLSRIVYSADSSMITLSADPAITAFTTGQAQTGSYGSGKLDTDDTRWFAVCKTSAGLSWNYILMIPSSDAFANTGSLSNPAILLGFIGLPILLLLFPVVLLKLLNPINKLTSVISGQDKASLPITHKNSDRYGPSSRKDQEPSTSDLDSLIEKIFSLNLKQKEAELNALQNQINPHFLYNTLESIRGAALYHGIHDIAAMSKALSLMFRYSINSTVLVAVKEEIQHLENYMSIQNFRYENKFELVYEIPFELYNYKILKLSLQPLIENSIKHGLEMKLGKGTIKITMFSLDNSIRIQVSDDGNGIPQKKIEELNRMLEREEYPSEGTGTAEQSGTGIGVRNVNSRIKLYFGEPYGLRFQNTLSGTVVEIILPEVREDE